MPSKSKKQKKFMAAAANNPKFAKKVGIKQSVAKEFHEADKELKGKPLADKVIREKKLPKRKLKPPERAKFAQGGLATMVKNALGRLPNRQAGQAAPQRFMGAPSSAKMTPPPRGALGRAAGRFAPRGRAGAAIGPARRSQVGAGARNAFRRSPQEGMAPNGLLRTAQDASGRYGVMLNRLQSGLKQPARMFAKGGSVKRAVAALHEARSSLRQGSDPDIDSIAKKLVTEVPGARRIATRMKALDRDMDLGDEELRQAWKQVHEELRQLQKRLSQEGSD